MALDGGTVEARCDWAEFDVERCGQLKAMRLGPLPPARGNRFGDDLAAARLGYQLFFDLDVLSPFAVRCASCHQPEHGFTTNVAQPRGRALLARNALSLHNAARTFPHFWDGRADSLWAQALLAIEKPEELGGNRLAIVRGVTTRYRQLYGDAFGVVPDFSDAARFPAEAAPGDERWLSLSAADRALVTSAFVNVGKALEAYVRRLARGPSAFDRFLDGDATALTPRQRAGALQFAKAGCARCHSGPNLSDGLFHRLDVPLPAQEPGRGLAEADRGRVQGRELWLSSEFNALSVDYDVDAGASRSLEGAEHPAVEGAFLTPSLRNVASTGPWGHDGVFVSLDDVVRFHVAGGGPGCVELEPRLLGDLEVDELVGFLESLDGTDPPREWTSWPGAYTPP